MEEQLQSTLWYAETYQPRATEYATDREFRAALKIHIGLKMQPHSLRLTHLSPSNVCAPGAMLPVASYRLDLDQVKPLHQACAICGKPVTPRHRSAVTSAGISIHGQCLPGVVPTKTVAELLPFAEELPEKRSLKQVLRLRRPER